MNSPFPARFPSACNKGCEGIEPGDMIRFVDDAIEHVDCDTATLERPASKTYPVCERCWLLHPEGACDL